MSRKVEAQRRRQAERIAVSLGALNGICAVALGAFGAHGLRQQLSEASLVIFETGVRYQMYHALALIALGVWLGADDRRFARWLPWLFQAGVVFFSGSLYTLALSGPRWLGAIAPVGGGCLIVAWGLWLLSALWPTGSAPQGRFGSSARHDAEREQDTSE